MRRNILSLPKNAINYLKGLICVFENANCVLGHLVKDVRTCLMQYNSKINYLQLNHLHNRQSNEYVNF